jgi:GAF domain-containing protein
MSESSEDFDDLTEQLAGLATSTVPAAVTSAITVSADGRVLTVACADGLGRLLDEQQYEIDEGPCLQAIRTAAVVSVPDLASDTRWNGYPPRILAHGISAVHCAPLMVRGQALGALNMYSSTPHGFDAPAIQHLIAGLANLAAAGMAGALANYDEITLTSRLRRALSTRGVIDQAIGIIIAAQHCSPTEAFDVLRKVSQARNIRLHQVAAELVNRTAQPQRAPTGSDAHL